MQMFKTENNEQVKVQTNQAGYKRNTQAALQLQEVWQQDSLESDFWHAPNGLMVNTSALIERETYFDIIRVPANALTA